MINDNLLWTTDEYEAVVDYKANSYNKIDTGTGFRHGDGVCRHGDGVCVYRVLAHRKKSVIVSTFKPYRQQLRPHV